MACRGSIRGVGGVEEGPARLGGDFLDGVVAVLGQGIAGLPALVPGVLQRLALGAERLGIASCRKLTRAVHLDPRPPMPLVG
jgi:hypothetical protein